MRHDRHSTGRVVTGVDGDATTRAFFKPDHPRAIDRYIDYFGDPRHGGTDVCGEGLLDAVAEAGPPSSARAS